MPKTPIASRPHDHSQCVHSALTEADTLCAQKGLRLTALRRRVLVAIDGGGQSEQFDQFHDDGSLGFDNELETHSIWRCAGSACAPIPT